MDLGAAGLLQQPFPKQGELLANALYKSQQDALKVLQDTHASPKGLCLFQGPSLSGKSTVVQQYVDTLPEDIAVAVVDGNKLNTAGLLEAVLRQFGYVLDHGSVTELLAMLRVFSMQQTVSKQPPLLIVENTHELNPGALRALCELAALKVRNSSAMKMVLVSDRSLQPIIETSPMEAIRNRVTHDFHLRPMTNSEACEHLQFKLLVAGCNLPDTIFPKAVCSEIWRASGGWPGILDRVALLTLSRVTKLPATVDLVGSANVPEGTWKGVLATDVAAKVEPQADPQADALVDPPIFFVTLDGQVTQEITMDQPRLLIGRSEHNDISLPSKLVSRHHALLIRSGNATFLMDLNSTNGVSVNSERTTSHFLIHDDVISIGNHRIKFIDTSATQRELVDSDQFADTAIMKTLDDMRNLFGQSENLPTAGKLQS